MTILVGYTGFVGSNLKMSHCFDGLYNSKNIEEAYGTNPDLLVYSGVPAQKFLANQNPEGDFNVILNAIENIKKINPKKLILISTIDVYRETNNSNEKTGIVPEDLQAYGKNRFYLEEWVKSNYEDYLIVRLPGLYGKNIKKNFIYDYINIIPSMLKEDKYEELKNNDSAIEGFYERSNNDFFKCRALNADEKHTLKKYFIKNGFSALNFTDSRGYYQFYNLKYLWEHIQLALNNNIRLLNLATEPVSIAELYKYLRGEEFINRISDNVANYNFKTIYSDLFGGKDGYIFSKDFLLKDIKDFVESENNGEN